MPQRSISEDGNRAVTAAGDQPEYYRHFDSYGGTFRSPRFPGCRLTPGGRRLASPLWLSYDYPQRHWVHAGVILKKTVDRIGILDALARELRERGAIKVAIFGSYSRGEEQPESDMDVIVEFSEKKSLLDLVAIERELSESLGVRVDLLTEQFISPYIIDTVREQMEVIYG